MTVQSENDHTLIHLLYVPTLFCNLGCYYCYLGEQTDGQQLALDNARALETLSYAVTKFEDSGVLPFNISLHGGEVTTLQPDTMDNLFTFISAYYKKHQSILYQYGFTKTVPHIKTNLYNFDQLIHLFEKHHVSVSASIDLPLSLHDQYRLTKNGHSTLAKTMDNLKLLSSYKYGKKFSSVIYQEHFLRRPEIIKDIWKIHNEVGFDMNSFNFMFGFETALNEEKFPQKAMDSQTLSGEQQVEFYQTMKEEFQDTELAVGFHKHWFEEFTPAFCTNSFNCGEKFFLLQSNGDIFSCVRGQGTEAFYFGNIFTHSVEDILANGVRKIKIIHNQEGLHSDCRTCNYLEICKTGCPFVKYQQGVGKSYTCQLQLAMYQDHPTLYPGSLTEQEREDALLLYQEENHPQQIFRETKPLKQEMILPNDLYQLKNGLGELIARDDILKSLYRQDAIKFAVDEKNYSLESQILKKSRQILLINGKNRLCVQICKELFHKNCNDLVRNHLYLMLLRDTKVVYGDEERTKQEHIFTHQIFYNVLTTSVSNTKEFFVIDIRDLLKFHQNVFIEGVLNNLFITTGSLRDYHYHKQKENAFYHIQAINLPFQNVEFYWGK